MMLALDEVDGLVSGAGAHHLNTILAALQLIRAAQGASIVSSIFFMLMPEEVLVYSDCAVINPKPEELADIAIQSAATPLGPSASIPPLLYDLLSGGLFWQW